MDSIEKPKICRYCGNEVVFTSNVEIYGKEYGNGKVYLCRKCRAYVGTHKGTDIPLGTLANEELRKARNLAHMYFDKLWRGETRQDTRYNMYGWLAKKMNLPREKTHIAMFEKEQCEKVVELAKERLNINKGKCEIFLKNLCLGCQALERLEDIDIAKYSCEIYKEMKNNERNGI